MNARTLAELQERRRVLREEQVTYDRTPIVAGDTVVMRGRFSEFIGEQYVAEVIRCQPTGFAAFGDTLRFATPAGEFLDLPAYLFKVAS